MGKSSKIEWTDATWNIAIGCDKVSAGCKNCYMMRDWDPKTSMKGKGRQIPVNGIVTRTKKATFNAPLSWQKSQRRSSGGNRLKVFTSSLTDFFHPQIDSYRNEAWNIIKQCPDLVFQILTKRPERIKEHLPEDWGAGYQNVWLGVSVESDNVEITSRIAVLNNIPSVVRFVSVEPMIEPTLLKRHDYSSLSSNHLIRAQFNLNHGITVPRTKYDTGIHWVIIGGESGFSTGKYQYRQCSIAWIEDLVEECKKYNTPVFVKQLGTHLKNEFKKLNVDLGRAGGKLENLSEEFQHLNVRQFPHAYFETKHEVEL